MTNGTGKPPQQGGDRLYVRFQVRYYGRLGVPVGIFAACHHLRRDGCLSPADEKLFTQVDDWFIARLPYPPFYSDGNSIRAVPWFKPGATAFIAAVAPLEDLLRRHGVPYDVVRSPNPGTIIYEDDFQIGVLPHVRNNAVNHKVNVTSGNALPRSRYEPYA